MGRTEALKRAQKNYIEQFRRIEIRVTKEDGERIDAAAALARKSVNQYIQDAIAAQMERDASE